jgi:hypothetical protein
MKPFHNNNTPTLHRIKTLNSEEHEKIIAYSLNYF